MCKTRSEPFPGGDRNTYRYYAIDEAEHERRQERNAKRNWPWGYVRPYTDAVYWRRPRGETLMCRTTSHPDYETRETWIKERQMTLRNNWRRRNPPEPREPRDGQVWIRPVLLVLAALAMCGQKRYFGDDRVDEHILFKRDMDMKRKTRESKKRMKDDDDRPHPWSWIVALAERLVRRPQGA